MLEELQHLMRRLAGDSTRFVLRQKEWKHKGSSTYQARPMARVHASGSARSSVTPLVPDLTTWTRATRVAPPPPPISRRPSTSC
ncbi:hypothetical protein VDGL01_00279 [Verticillium dahliae]